MTSPRVVNLGTAIGVNGMKDFLKEEAEMMIQTQMYLARVQGFRIMLCGGKMEKETAMM